MDQTLRDYSHGIAYMKLIIFSFLVAVLFFVMCLRGNGCLREKNIFQWHLEKEHYLKTPKKLLFVVTDCETQR